MEIVGQRRTGAEPANCYRGWSRVSPRATDEAGANEQKGGLCGDRRRALEGGRIKPN